MIMRRLSRRERKIAVLAGICLVSTVLYVCVAEPYAQGLYAAHKRVQQAQSEVDRLAILIANRDTIAAEYDRVKGAMSTVSSEHQMMVALLEEVDKAARSAGLQLTNVKPLSSQKHGTFWRFGLELQTQCEGHQFVEFLQVMQAPEHMLRAELIALTVGRSEPPLTVTFKIDKLAKLER